MSARTEIEVEPGPDVPGAPAGTLLFKLRKAPVMIGGPKGWYPFACAPGALPSLQSPGTPVRDYGQQVLTGLYTHPRVKEAIEDALKQPPNVRRPIYFRLQTDEVEQIHWESLCDAKGKFLALDARWQVGRIAEPEIDAAARWHTFAPPLRIMAFLSPAGIDPGAEFDALYAAVNAARDKGLAIELVAVIGHGKVYDSVQAGIDQGKLVGTVRLSMPDRHAGIIDLINERRPHIIHFFCHGYTGHGVAQLELGTLADDEAGNTVGSTVLHLNDLESIAGMRDIDLWLVTLNCCMGGRAADGLPSMARALVNQGAPVVVAMTEPLPADDANEFARSFYTEVLNTFAKGLSNAPLGTTVDVEWAELLCRARDALGGRNGRDAAKDHEWTLPVLYARPEPFGIVMIDDTVRKRIDRIAEALRALPPDSPADVRDGLLALIPPGAPAILRPDRFGRFPT